ncbi:MAG: hypothetical protein LBL21_00490 [Rickettsiales bacterium]|jgi:hypothetical protein|nr:hypothetical protein [Rickettsiales bacterium]
MKKIIAIAGILLARESYASTCAAGFAEDSYFEIADSCDAGAGYEEDKARAYLETGDCGSLGAGWVEDTGGEYGIPPEKEFSDSGGTFHFSNMCEYRP